MLWLNGSLWNQKWFFSGIAWRTFWSTFIFKSVTGPTHNHGHTLDLITSCGLTVSHPQIVDFVISDHYCVFCEISVCTKTVSDKRTVNKYNLYADSATTFMELISSLPPLTFPSVNTYAENFSLRLSKCIDTVQRRCRVATTEWMNETHLSMFHSVF